jgi:hypothetical protein
LNSKPLIEKALGELHLIIDGDHSEHDLQKWFERHSVVFEALGYVQTISHPSFFYDDEEYIPDFMVKNSLDLWEIFEIKTADAGILKNTDRRHAFYSKMQDYLSQCREYSKSFTDIACKKRINNDYKINCNNSPDITIIIGRNDGYDKFLTHELLGSLAFKVKILTYDDLDNILSSFVENAFGQVVKKVSGLFTTCAVNILQSEPIKTQYILDICKRGTKNRIQLFISENRIQVIATDKNGETVTMRSTENTYRMSIGSYIELCIQIENHTNDSSIELLIDGALICESRTRDVSFDFSGELDMVIGSDQNGHEPSSMLFGGNIVIQAIPLLYEKWVLRSFVANLKDEIGNPYVEEFIGHKFKHNCGHQTLGSKMAYQFQFIQEDKNKEPILRYVQ